MSNQDYDDDDIVTLQTQSGEEVDFVEIAGIAYRGNFYAILQPVELLDGMDDNEALVFKVSKTRDGEDHFEIELDDKIIDAVFAEYNKLLDEAEAEERGGNSGNKGGRKPVNKGGSSGSRSGSGSRSRGGSKGSKVTIGGIISKIVFIIGTVIAAFFILVGGIMVSSSISTGDTSGMVVGAVIIAIVLIIWLSFFFASRNKKK